MGSKELKHDDGHREAPQPMTTPSLIVLEIVTQAQNEPVLVEVQIVVVGIRQEVAVSDIEHGLLSKCG